MLLEFAGSLPMSPGVFLELFLQPPKRGFGFYRHTRSLAALRELFQKRKCVIAGNVLEHFDTSKLTKAIRIRLKSL
ncbi:MAG: hypothetical protein KatS3mg105_2603 [Gemmatales bacterium]|nr:MAG: hypothetical protein KatS3mg105_2603 [Gemmatales bacterium]